MRKMFPFDDVIMRHLITACSWKVETYHQLIDHTIYGPTKSNGDQVPTKDGPLSDPGFFVHGTVADRIFSQMNDNGYNVSFSLQYAIDIKVWITC